MRVDIDLNISPDHPKIKNTEDDEQRNYVLR